ncbi:hypothetical protein OUZ56_019533 [Daphnia magna]|uniref:Uncharacterized protein n=1 Tax=Daphnia magna TaxID=35525 RepID=A0ABQ9ZCX3_9CRUS|nr:hypothetical protein OUZ56_019533 [Daphnia magna]
MQGQVVPNQKLELVIHRVRDAGQYKRSRFDYEGTSVPPISSLRRLPINPSATGRFSIKADKNEIGPNPSISMHGYFSPTIFS